MTFVIPPIQQTNLTAAAISTQVWSDKEVIGAKTFYIENYAKTSGILISTPYTALDLTNVDAILVMFAISDNTDNVAKNMTFTLTIDGEAFVYASDSISDNTKIYFSLEPQTPGTNAILTWVAAEVGGFGVRTHEIIGSTDKYQGQKEFGGKAVTFVYQYDEAPGTAQLFKLDCYYTKIVVL